MADSVPTQEIQKIPPSEPVYNVTYVTVYESTPEVVYVGYTPGYMWSYPWYGCPVYGTGYYYPPYWGSVYYPRPVTYGVHVSYNPYTGWGMGFSYSTGFMTVGVHFGGGYGGYYRPGYPPGYYRPPGCYPPGGYRPAATVPRESAVAAERYEPAVLFRAAESQSGLPGAAERRESFRAAATVDRLERRGAARRRRPAALALGLHRLLHLAHGHTEQRPEEEHDAHTAAVEQEEEVRGLGDDLAERHRRHGCLEEMEEPFADQDTAHFAQHEQENHDESRRHRRSLRWACDVGAWR